MDCEFPADETETISEDGQIAIGCTFAKRIRNRAILILLQFIIGNTASLAIFSPT